MEDAWEQVRRASVFSKTIVAAAQSKEAEHRGRELWDKCKARQAASDSDIDHEDISDERLSHLAKFTDHLPLALYDGYYELVPQLVNVVTLCEALPHPSSVGGGKLPLDLHLIAARCSNSCARPAFQCTHWHQRERHCHYKPRRDR